jgi:membrane protein DedA with SNARE-associated domain
VIYLSIFFFAIIEGEIYYSAMCAKAIAGDLPWVLVMVAGALGGATGDQFWFYLLRGRIHWVDRYPRLGKYRARISAHVHSHETAILLVSRFLPGLRTAVPVACAYANVRPIKFSVLNLMSAFAWAGGIMLLVRGGSRTLSALGLNAWWGPFIPAALIILFFRWLGSRPARDKQA